MSAQLNGRAYDPIPFRPPRADVPERVIGPPVRVVANGRAAKVVGYRLAVVVEYDSGGRETLPIDVTGQFAASEIYYHPELIDEENGGWFQRGRTP